MHKIYLFFLATLFVSISSIKAMQEYQKLGREAEFAFEIGDEKRAVSALQKKVNLTIKEHSASYEEALRYELKQDPFFHDRWGTLIVLHKTEMDSARNKAIIKLGAVEERIRTKIGLPDEKKYFLKLIDQNELTEQELDRLGMIN